MENWVNIKYLEGYQISNLGNVKTLNYHKTGKERILKLSLNSKGYLCVRLYKNGKVKNYLVHRLVWMAFNGEIPEGMQINHKSEVKTDNRLENLELMTCKENINWGTGNERRAEKLTNGKCSKPVLQYSLDDELICEWPSQAEVKRQLGYSQGNIWSCCSGRLKSAYGYIWKYKN